MGPGKLIVWSTADVSLWRLFCPNMAHGAGHYGWRPLDWNSTPYVPWFKPIELRGHVHWLALSKSQLKNFEFGPQSKFESLAILWVQTLCEAIWKSVSAHCKLKLRKTTFKNHRNKLNDRWNKPLNWCNANQEFSLCYDLQAYAVYRPSLLFWRGFNSAEITD